MTQAITNYTFNAASKQITFSDYGSIAIERVLLIRNLVTGTYIYKATDLAFGGTVATNILTFTASNSGMSNGDALLIRYDPAISLDTQKVDVGTIVLPTGAATETKQDTGNTSLSNINSKIPALGGALVAASIPVNIASNQTVPVSITGVSTSALQTTGNTSVGSIDTKTPVLGAAVIASSVPVNIASNQTVPVSISGGSTSALQTTGNTSLGNIDTKTPALGAATIANSTPVNIASNQTVPVSGTVTTTPPSNASTNVAQVGGSNVSLGQQLIAASIPVALATEDVQDLAITGQSAQTAVVNNILTVASGASATDVGMFRSFTVQVVSTGTGGTYIFEGSNDNTNFQSTPVFNQALAIPVPIVTAITATSSSIIYAGACNFRFLRLRIATTITGGSIQAFTNYTQYPISTTQMVVAQGTAANLLTTATIASGTVTTVSTVTSLTTLANGQTAHSSASTGSPVRVGGRVLPVTPDLTLVAGDASDLGITTGQQALTKDFAPAELDYTFCGSISNSTTALVFKNAAGASIRNYVTSLVVNSDTLTAATEIVIKDGAISTTSLTTNTFTSGTHDYKIGDQIVFSNIASYTGVTANTIYYILTVPSATTYTISLTPNGAQVTGLGGTGTATSNRILFRSKLQTTSFGPASFIFSNPLRGIPNGTLDFQTITATIAGAIYYNVQGYIGF